jgi:glycosyltransferase involved in cell wall biosynthesis
VSGVHQFVAAFEPGAVGQHIVAVQSVLRSWGHDSAVFAGEVRPFDGVTAHHYRDYGAAVPASADDVLVYHLAIGSDVASFLAERRETLIVWYHNVTPPEYFAPWDASLVPGVEWGRSQLRAMADRAIAGIGVSRFNERDLHASGYRRTAVVPVLLDLHDLHRDVDAATLARLRSAKSEGGADAVFVGRIVPNKAQHDLVKLAATYGALYHEPLRMHIVGGSDCAPYADALRAYVERLHVASTVEITGSVSRAELAAYYSAADVFVSASEHEGFCVPLLEALSFGLPIVAYAGGAVPETLGDAGVVLATKAPVTLAAAVHRVVDDAAVRRDLLERAAPRLAHYDPDRVAQALRRTLLDWGIGPR